MKFLNGLTSIRGNKMTNKKGLLFWFLLFENYLYMFSGIVFAFWIVKEHPIWAILLLIGAFAFFKGLIGIGRDLKDVKKYKNFYPDKYVTGSRIDTIIHEVETDGMAKQSKDGTKKGRNKGGD